MTKHVWQTVNREYHKPEELSVPDVVEEIACALGTLPEDTFIQLAKAIDAGNYPLVGVYIEDAFNRLPKK